MKRRMEMKGEITTKGRRENERRKERRKEGKKKRK